MALWLVLFWFAAYSLVPSLLRWAGISSAGGATQALRHLVLDSIMVGATLLLLRRGLREHAPRRLGLFAAPLHPLRRWLPAVLAGAATFPFVDWVHRRMVDLLSLEQAAASGTAEQILGTSSWGTQALWFGVLAVCAPVWEELIFRGFLLPSLARYLPRWGALAATSLLFAMVHFSREGLLPLLLLGCVFGGAYASTRNLLAPIALHSLWNVCLLVQLLRAGAGV
ncbi:hypothetical protein ABPG75_005697 [Micractinium tetrahymenae]